MIKTVLNHSTILLVLTVGFALLAVGCAEGEGVFIIKQTAVPGAEEVVVTTSIIPTVLIVSQSPDEAPATTVPVPTAPANSTTTVPVSSIAPTAPPPTPGPTVTPTPPPPSASFIGDNLSGEAPFNVAFTASIDGSVDSYEWEFGDGATSVEATPVHEYTVAGVYTVRLNIEGPDGSSTSFRNGFVSVYPGPAAVISVEPQNPILSAQETIKFSVQVVDSFGNKVDSQVTWTVDESAGTLTDSGMFTASTVAGNYSQAITASVGNDTGRVSAEIDISVLPGALHTIGITPINPTLPVNSFAKFDVHPTDIFDNEITDFVATWRADPLVGSIDDTGGFIATTTSGIYPDGILVEIVRGATRETTSVDVIVEAGQIAVISIEPSSIYISGVGTRHFSAKAIDDFGNEVTVSEFSWASSGGSITGDGEFIANGDYGTHEVSAQVRNVSSELGLAQVEVLPATTLVVETEHDSVDTNPGDGFCADSGGQCSLRAAVMEANARAGTDIVSLAAGNYVLTREGAGEDNAGWGDLDIRESLKMYGVTSELTVIDGNATDRVLQIFSGATVEIHGVDIRNGSTTNSSFQRGGGILNYGSLTLIESALTNNTVNDLGSALFMGTDSTAIIMRSTLSRNHSRGATVFNGGGGLILINDSTFHDNNADGVLYNEWDGTIRVTNSTLSGNNSGGGHNHIFNRGDIRITNSTIYSDSRASFLVHNEGRLEFLNSIIQSGSSLGCNSNFGGVGFVSLGHNIASDFSCSLLDDSDQIGVDAMLGPLQDNGGPTLTHALLPGSPAIDAGENAASPTSDQRGIPRPAGAASDIGSYESQ